MTLRSAGVQLACLSLCWLGVVLLHVDNDGLWFQGDAPRHASNGALVQDFASEPTWRMRDYAVSFYARYPVINPVGYPPGFYALEAVAYAVLGRSPATAKLLILSFCWLGMYYAWRWLRRWVGPAAGWGAALWLAAPETIVWSHTIVLNIPAMAMTMVTLYYGRLWLTEPGTRLATRNGVLTLLSLAAGVGIYYHAIAALGVLAAWVPLIKTSPERRRALLRWMAVLVPLAALGLWGCWKWSRIGATWDDEAWSRLGQADQWLAYVLQIGRTVGAATAVLALYGWLVSIGHRPWRDEAVLTAVWFGVVLLALTLIPAREIRYSVLLIPPAVLAATTTLARLHELVARSQQSGSQTSRAARAAWIAGLVCVAAIATGQAIAAPMPEVHGIDAAARYAVEHVDGEPVLYDGYFNGIFTYYVMINDPGRESHVLLGNKTFYTYAYTAGWKERSFVDDAQDVVDMLQHELGCRWLAIEYGSHDQDTPAMKLLRKAVEQPEFERVASFPAAGLGLDRIDLFRLRLPVEPQSEWTIPFQTLGSGTVLRARPLPPRGVSNQGRRVPSGSP